MRLVAFSSASSDCLLTLLSDTAAYKVDPKIECYCMGSYRRGEESSGDIDIMVTRPPVPGEEGVGASLSCGVISPK